MLIRLLHQRVPLIVDYDRGVQRESIHPVFSSRKNTTFVLPSSFNRDDKETAKIISRRDPLEDFRIGANFICHVDSIKRQGDLSRVRLNVGRGIKLRSE
jgi:hypothetical protein